MLDNMATTKMALSSGPRVFEAREHSQDSLIATPIAVREREQYGRGVCAADEAERMLFNGTRVCICNQSCLVRLVTRLTPSKFSCR